jgi:hypothetical protein
MSVSERGRPRPDATADYHDFPDIRRIKPWGEYGTI